jgi:hypothetical protein
MKPIRLLLCVCLATMSAAVVQAQTVATGRVMYSRQSEAFLNALRDLDAAVKARDLDAAMGHYTELTMTCYRCHRYITDHRRAAQ